MKIKVRVDGRPPTKSKPTSLWRGKIAGRVLKLRRAILEKQQKLGVRGPFKSHVRMTLRVYAPNVDGQNQLPYVGDIDSLVAGVCDSIRAADNNMKKPNRVFEGHDKVGPNKQLLIKDDSQVVEVDAKKIESEEERYVLTVQELS